MTRRSNKDALNFNIYCNMVNGRLNHYIGFNIDNNCIRDILIGLIDTMMDYFYIHADNERKDPIDFIASYGIHLYGLAADKYKNRVLFYIGKDLKNITDSGIIDLNIYNFYNLLYKHLIEINREYFVKSNIDINTFYTIMHHIMFEIEEYFVNISSILTFYDYKYTEYFDEPGKYREWYDLIITTVLDDAIMMSQCGVMLD